ncbi:Uncharacterised protein [Mycobacterium tuberculosis]|nr:Uncharacterised protein [Mycobacterium tuberculosis]
MEEDPIKVPGAIAGGQDQRPCLQRIPFIDCNPFQGPLDNLKIGQTLPKPDLSPGRFNLAPEFGNHLP